MEDTFSVDPYRVCIMKVAVVRSDKMVVEAEDSPGTQR
jgi:hypothetical protein